MMIDVASPIVNTPHNTGTSNLIDEHGPIPWDSQVHLDEQPKILSCGGSVHLIAYPYLTAEMVADP